MKQNLSYYDDYRQIINDKVKTLNLTFKKLSETTGIHNSYISRVLGKGSDFSRDQMFLVGKSIGLSDWEFEYFLLLGDFQASSDRQHKEFLLQKIKKFKNEHQKIKEILIGDIHEFSNREIESYYLSPLTAEIHICLTLEKYRKNPELLLKYFTLSKNELENELTKLEQLKIISREKDRISLNKKVIHLDENHPIMSKFLNDRRIDCLTHLSRKGRNLEDYHFSVLFSTSEEKKQQIKLLFKEFIQKAQKTSNLPIGTQKNINVFKMNFDLY